MWKCVFDSATGKGVAFGRQAGEGEFMVELPPADCGWFNAYPERYQYVDGAFSERAEWLAEQQTLRKSKALAAQLAAIDAAVRARVAEPFSWNGNTWYPDVEFIQGIYTALPLLPDEYTETWKTADVAADGITNIYVTLDKAGITGLAMALLQHKKSWWSAGEQKKVAIKALMADPEATAADIEAYDITLA